MRNPDQEKGRWQRAKDNFSSVASVATIPAVVALIPLTDIAIRSSKRRKSDMDIYKKGVYKTTKLPIGPFETIMNQGETMVGRIAGEPIIIYDLEPGYDHGGRGRVRIGGKIKKHTKKDGKVTFHMRGGRTYILEHGKGIRVGKDGLNLKYTRPRRSST